MLKPDRFNFKLLVSDQISVDLIDQNIMDVFRSTLTLEEKRRLAQQLNR